MTDIRPMWSTTVDPSEYDVDGQMEDFVKAANKAKECYYGIDVGKLWGLYKAYKSQSDELATLRAQLAEAKDIVIVLAWLDEILQPDESKEFVSVNILTSTIKKAHAWHSKVNSA